MTIKEHFTNNWKNYLIIFLILFVLSFSFQDFGSFSLSKNLDSQQLSYDGFSRYGGYYQNSDFAPDSQERIIIKRANLNLETDNYDETKNKIKNVLGNYNAIILSESETKYKDKYRTNFLNIKVKVENLDTVLDEIKQFGEVQSLNIYSNDVTQRHEDYSSRLQRYETQISKYSTMLSKNNLEIKDEIDIQERIDDLENQIFNLKNSISSLDNNVKYSSLSISFKEKPSILGEIDFVGFKDSIKIFMDSLDFGIRSVLYLLGFLIPFGIIYLIYRFVKKFI